jgi:putative Mg2+ transporter-C (MgtC) family protein
VNPLISLAVTDLEMAIRLLMAAVCGAGVGYQRESANKAAGLRTHILVAVGSALFTLVSMFAFGDRADPSRVAAQIVVGIGFIGAGAILHSQMTVTGVTTAASIWVTAAIGMAAGVGMYFMTIVCTVIVLVVLQLHKHREAQDDQIASQRHLNNLRDAMGIQPKVSLQAPRQDIGVHNSPTG